VNLGHCNSVVISISGGKDSQTIMGVVIALARSQGYAGAISAVHADTGAEWPQSLPHCRMLCEHYGIPLAVAVPHRALPGAAGAYRATLPYAAGAGPGRRMAVGGVSVLHQRLQA
jgi:3'-phosphoadenosine 5'-phosphosulfate sulfotransferase (PAPS reductase)/FAD synthetase